MAGARIPEFESHMPSQTVRLSTLLRALDRAAFLGARRRASRPLPNVIAIDGGVPIKVGNDVIGGVGVSGDRAPTHEPTREAAMAAFARS
jgi:uncharacterized protein GlcG (DUF336 family)